MGNNFRNANLKITTHICTFYIYKPTNALHEGEIVYNGNKIMKQVPIYTKRLYICGLFYFKFSHINKFISHENFPRALYGACQLLLKCKGRKNTPIFSYAFNKFNYFKFHIWYENLRQIIVSDSLCIQYTDIV